MLVRVQVTGVVQGVGFRWFVRERARRLGLAGWARNQEDGSVEIAASGPDDAIADFLREVRRGPSGARVEELRRLPTDGLPALQQPFSILR